MDSDLREPRPDDASRPPLAVHPKLTEVFGALDQSGEAWLLLGSEDILASPREELHLLVAPELLPQLETLLRSVGLHRILSRDHGSSQHYVSYLAEEGFWLRLHLTSDIAFGPYQQWRLGLAAAVLEHRVQDGPLWRPRPSDGAWWQLLRLLLERRNLSSRRLPQAVQAAHQADLDGEFAAALDALTGPGSARELVIGARSARLPDIRSLAGDLRRAWTKQTATATTLLGVRSQALRLLRPPSLRHRRHSGLMVVAMGPQRSGATPVLRAVGTTFPIPSRHVCMTGWTMRRHDPQLRPGAHDASPARLVMMLAAAVTVLYHVRRGRLVLLEKVTYDSAGSSPATAVLSRIVEWLSPSGFRADVLVVLQAPDQQGGQPSPAPAPPGTSLCLLDATLPPAELHRRVTDCVWQRFLQPAG